jgi:hypothetical protein
MTSKSAKLLHPEGGRFFRLDLELARTSDETPQDAVLSGCTAVAQINPTVAAIEGKIRVLLVTARLDMEEDYSSA